MVVFCVFAVAFFVVLLSFDEEEAEEEEGDVWDERKGDTEDEDDEDRGEGVGGCCFLRDEEGG